jgi:2-desacetyl-2-hydroxyethyl bacteriochlorophyllide A dehydrogenase
MVRTSAVRFRAPRSVGLVKIDLPPVGEGQALVRTLCSGISGGTELLAYRGEIDPNTPLDDTLEALSGTFAFPFAYGYSIVGVVEQSACDLEEGALVFCFHSHQGHVVAPCREMVVLEGIEPRLATMFPLVETALQISLDAGLVNDETVVVLGLGPVGLLTGVLLARAGATVLGSDPLTWRRAVGGSFSVDAVAPEDIASRTAEATGGGGVPLVVETSGNPQALTSALSLLAHEGVALVASWYGTRPVELPLGGSFHRRRLTLKSTQVSTIAASQSVRWSIDRRRQAALRLMGELPLKRLATHDFPLRQAADAFRALDTKSEGLIHAALIYDEE